MAGLSRLLTRRRTFYLVLLLICAGVSLRPVDVVERGLELVFVPARVIVELTVPARWWRAGDARRAEESLWDQAPETRASAEELLADEQEFARPSHELCVDRRLIHGEVIGRERDDLDRIVIRVATAEGIVPGLPVVTGDWYVGRVTFLDESDPLLIHAELVTGSDFRVGAEVQATDRFERSVDPIPLVVGGLSNEFANDEGSLYLTLHNPLRRGLRSDPVVIEEAVAFDRVQADLAHGFKLGDLDPVRREDGSEELRIEPGVDFKSGLFQVIVLAPPLPSVGGVERAAIEAAASGLAPVASEEEVLELDTFVAAHWIDAVALTRGDVSRGREGRRLSRGRLAGVESGSAVGFGGHLIGRVGGVGYLTSDLLELGDPGLRLAVLARLAGERQPRPLGEIVSRGRRRSDGLLSFRWICRVDLPGEDGDRLEVKLYTGSGEPGVPRGLYVGRTLLPVGRKSHELIVEQDVEAREVDSLFVWRGPGGGGTR